MPRLFLLLASAVFSVNAAALELAKYPQVFDAGQGVSVQLAPSVDGKQALIQVSGINHPVDGVVFLTDVAERGNDERDYGTTLDGRSFNLVVKRQGWSGESYQLYLPGTEGFTLSFNEARSKTSKPADLQAQYDKQKAKGVQAKLATFDRDKRLKSTQSELQQLDQAASSACGVSLTTQVDWPKVTDQQLLELSVASFCGEVASQVGRLCQDDSAFKRQARTIKGLECRFDRAMKLREEDGVIRFATEKDAPNQGDFIRAFLLNR
ncbi:hypothetical protein [Aquipseudomonas campi]